MKKSISTTIITALSFIFSISLISATAYAQQQQDQAASLLNKIQATQSKTYYQVMNHLKLNWI